MEYNIKIKAEFKDKYTEDKFYDYVVLMLRTFEGNINRYNPVEGFKIDLKKKLFKKSK